MDFNLREFEIQGTTKCECGHEFVINDITELKRINQPGFYGNVIKHCSYTQCPKCYKETMLLLRQKGQTYEVLDIALPKNTEKVVTEPENKNEEKTNVSNELICPVCKKVCKSQIGLNSHMRAHQK